MSRVRLSNNCRCEASCCFYPSVFSAPSGSFDSNTDCLSLSSAEKTQSDFSVSCDDTVYVKWRSLTFTQSTASKYTSSTKSNSAILLPLNCLRAFASSLITLIISGFEYLSLWDGWDTNTVTSSSSLYSEKTNDTQQNLKPTKSTERE